MQRDENHTKTTLGEHTPKPGGCYRKASSCSPCHYQVLTDSARQPGEKFCRQTMMPEHCSPPGQTCEPEAAGPAARAIFERPFPPPGLHLGLLSAWKIHVSESACNPSFVSVKSSVNPIAKVAPYPKFTIKTLHASYVHILCIHMYVIYTHIIIYIYISGDFTVI